MTTNDVSALQFKFDTSTLDATKNAEKTEEKPAAEVTVPVGQQVSDAKNKIATAIKNNNSLSSGLAGSGLSETSFNDKLFNVADVPDEVKQDSGFKSFMANLWGTKKAESIKVSDATATDTPAVQTSISDEQLSSLKEKVQNGGVLTGDEEKALTASMDAQLKAIDEAFAKDCPDFKADTSKLSGVKVSDAAESTGASAEDIKAALDFTASHQAEVDAGTVKDSADFKNLPANVQAYALKQYAAAGAGATEN